MKLKLLLKTLPKLGIFNLFRVAIYRLSLKFRLNPVLKLETTPIVSGSRFYRGKTSGFSNIQARQGWVDWYEAFGIKGKIASDKPPEWHKNIISGAIAKGDEVWFRISDFDGKLGDIKGVWEASRMDWVIGLAQHAANGESQYLHRLNAWLDDWCSNNAPYRGVNWKCGQEASIRVMHLAMTAFIFNEWRTPQPALIQLIKMHLQRISPTLMYAVAQDNNHATSEAAALFIGGSWLQYIGEPIGKQYAKKGRKWLENRATRLIMKDGSFSQYSVNYHRLMLDTYSWVEVWRSALELPKFSSTLYQRLRLATDWLANMVVGQEGETPVQGSNDGARLIPLTDTNYRDYRPSVQLATVVFWNHSAYCANGDYDLPLQWLNLNKPASIHDARMSQDYPHGGYSILRSRRSAVLFKYPKSQFRPSVGDHLHIDVWIDGRCVLCDSGSFSYNTDTKWMTYFKSAAAHNTVQFDDREAMPSISRFLVGEWLNVEHHSTNINDDSQTVSAAYCDYKGAKHHRHVTLNANSLEIVDTISAFKERAVLRWRLYGGDWVKTQFGVENSNCSLNILSEDDSTALKISLTDGWISEYYSQKSRIQVLEIEVLKPCHLITQMKF